MRPAVLLLIILAAQAQSPSFEVASVKRNESGSVGGVVISGNPSRFTTTNAPLDRIIAYAFVVRDYQVMDLPDWAHEERFDIAAKYPDGTPNLRQVTLMVQTLLAERFKLKAHRETRQLPIYALVLARRDGRLGPKLKPMTVDCAAYIKDKLAAGETVAAKAIGDAPLCAPMIVSRQLIKASVKPLSTLAFGLSTQVGRDVVDRTALTGNFDFNLEWSFRASELSASAPGADASGQAPPRNEGVSLFTALEDQLGLKLESTRGPVEVIVIDHVEPPTPN